MAAAMAVVVATEEERKQQQREWSIEIQSKQYLGEISALCFLHLPFSFSSFPFLLAGSGSQLLLYDIQAGNLITSIHVFQGIRVHGITCSSIINTIEMPSASTIMVFKIAVFGEKRVKLFHLNIQLLSLRLSDNNQQQLQPGGVCVDLTLIHSLPKFGHWVLDVLFLKGHASSLSEEGNHCLAIGLSDNSVRLWDVSRSSVTLEVQSPDKCLLYSMRLWGDSLEALRIASGTIYNEIIIWKVVPQKGSSPLTSHVENNLDFSSLLSDDFVQLHSMLYKAVHMHRLVGHEGSIFRIAWSCDGSKLLSVSDDRSARVWTVNAEQKESDNLKEVVGPVLFGHSARVWDCCISDSLIVTAGEDCTCRVWGLDGMQLRMIRDHIGRGIWRCLYDPSSSLLITAGFDSAIKVHQLHSSLCQSLVGQAKAEEFDDRTNVFTICLPNSSEHIGLMDSKSEYVRCLHFTCEDTLYVATNHGYLYHAKSSDAGDVKWTKLVHVSEKVPIISMDLLSKNLSKKTGNVDDWVALGDGKGSMTIVRVIGNVCAPEVALTVTWSAELERQLLGTHWCKTLGERFVFTADPRGTLKLWRLCDPTLNVSDDIERDINASRIAEFKSCFGIRIMCLDASFDEEVLVCGDLRGNLLLFPLIKVLLLNVCATSEAKIPPLNYFKGAHGISRVSSVSVARICANEIEIRSTGGDGCICHFKYVRDRKILEFIGMKQVKELSLIESVSADNNSVDDLANCNYAAGFASADFIIWNLITEAKVAEIPCGGWRRPHSYYFGAVPEKKSCFAYVKDETIYVRRRWEPEKERNVFPMNLHMQFHGQEMHSVCFVTENVKVGANGDQSLADKSSWIASGCEDGTVRLTRYDGRVENWSESKLLGEHVSGSAVRSICCVSNIYTIASDASSMIEETNGKYAAAEDRENPFLLISVGAKRVLTSWMLRNRSKNRKEETLVGQQPEENGNDYRTSLKGSSSMSFQWLSTDMQNKNSSTHGKRENTEQIVDSTDNVNSLNHDVKSRTLSPEKRQTSSKFCLGDNDDDWRYLAVTAFLAKCAGSRLTVCFVVVACSDATLALRALILPHRLWFDVAVLVPLSSPVLALQHIIIPTHPPSEENMHSQNAYIVITGATDGSVAFWDLTESIEAFVQQVSKLNIEKFIDCQKRPRTGRGSQGGRWWRSLGRRTSERRLPGGSVTVKAGERTSHDMRSHPASGASQKLCDLEGVSANCSQATHNAITESEGTTASSSPVCEIAELNTVDSFPEIYEIHPIHVLNNLHQSGVNCLHVSHIENYQSSAYGFQFHVISGGDDQALHCLQFDLSTRPDSKVMMPYFINSIKESESRKNPIKYSRNENQNYMIRISHQDSIASAHSSAIKGVWTDGTWAFSTGLDQRVRCWLIEENGKLREHAHIITSVPEPEALDGKPCSRNHYQITVAGRGMQMVEFSASCNRNDGE